MVPEEELRATSERMAARLAALADPSLIEPRRIYEELRARFEKDLAGSPRDVALAKSAALMVLQALAEARERSSALINIDVADLQVATEFYCQALGLGVGRRFGDAAVELLGSSAAIYLLAKPAGSPAVPSIAQRRDYARHWTPVHLDFVVAEIDAAVARARGAGAVLEGAIASHPWGRIALMADPFGNGFCLVQFVGRGYDEVLEKA
jgi:predicted enzyme related to lactoylglutathione lyase